MTIVFSIATPQFIAMTVDSSVTLEFADHREYTLGQKVWRFDGTGCVATWGTRTGNKLDRFLGNRVVTTSMTVDDLAHLVNRYLREEYRPHEESLDDVGYHVAGFDQSGRPRLHHVVWGIERPAPIGRPNPQSYRWSEHHPAPNQMMFLYNGRNDLAQTVVQALLDEIRRGQDVNFDLTKAHGMIKFGDFVTRFAAELTPQVGPPFITSLITRSNHTDYIVNESLSPVGEKAIADMLERLDAQQRA